MRTTRFRRSLAAGASAVIAAAGLAALAPTAQAAPGDEMIYDCELSLLGIQPFKTVATTNLPDQVERGSNTRVRFRATVKAADNIRSTALLLFGPEVSGTATVNVSIGGQSVTANATIPRTAIPATPDTELVLDVAGNAAWTPKGKGNQEVRLEGYEANLVFHKADNSTVELPVPCAANAETDTVIDTVRVVPPSVKNSNTRVKANYKKKAKRVVANVTVKSAGNAAKGKVRVVLKKGKKNAAKPRVVKLNKNGKKKLVFKNVRAKGQYRVLVNYQGNKNTKKSKRVVKFRVR